MKINLLLIKDFVQRSFSKGYLEIIDHRNNSIILNNGIFMFNGCQQPKSKTSIEAIFLEAFRLTRSIRLGDKMYTREKNKWYLKK